MKRAIAFFLILAPLTVGGGPAWLSPAKAAAEELDFRPYVHGKVRRNSYSFFCLMETGGRHIVGLLNRYLAGELSNEKVGEEIRKKAVVYKCAREYLTHMSTETLIRAKTPDFESFDGRLIQITKDSSLVKAQAKGGLTVYVVTNARVPLLEGEEPPKKPQSPETVKKSGPDDIPETGAVPETGAIPEAGAAPEAKVEPETGTVPEPGSQEKTRAKIDGGEPESRPDEAKENFVKTEKRGESPKGDGETKKEAGKTVESTSEKPSEEPEGDSPFEESTSD